MILENKSDSLIVFHNGKTYIKLESGESTKVESEAALKALKRFDPFLQEKKEILTKKASKKGKDKKLKKLEE